MCARATGRVTILETPRLRLRHLETGDAPFILRLLNGEDFLRFIGDRGVRTVEDAEAYVRNVAQASYDAHGFGLFLVEEKTGRSALGVCGVMRKPWLDGPDLAYAFLPEAEGMGYATEAARGVLDWVRRDAGLHRVVAVVVPENRGSVRVLTKLGFTREGDAEDPSDGTALELYSSSARSADGG